MSKSDGAHTPLAKGELAMAAAAHKGRAGRAEHGSEGMIERTRERAKGAEHRADLNVGSMGTRRGKRGHRGIGA